MNTELSVLIVTARVSKMWTVSPIINYVCKYGNVELQIIIKLLHMFIISWYLHGKVSSHWPLDEGFEFKSNQIKLNWYRRFKRCR